jgi:1-acyl-sn-glycerol-3-phosphate acyltransferase
LSVSSVALLRIVAKLAAMAAVTAWLAPLTVLRRLLARDDASRRRAGSEGLRRWGRAFWRILGMRVRVEGAIPEAPYLLVSNHVSYVDILLLGGLLGPVFVSKAEVARWPILGYLTRVAGTVYLDRSRIRAIPQVMREMDAIRDAKLGVVLFPEGTTTDGTCVEPFRPSLLEAAAREARPVRWAALSYRTPPGAADARDAVAWWGDATLAGHMGKLLRLRGFEATVRFGDERVVAEDRKRLAAELEGWVRGAVAGSSGAETG